MLQYEGNVIRPPSEAGSLIIQATVGCSHNKCTFCGAYKGVRFRIKDEQKLEEELIFASKHLQTVNKVFLADGDALILPQKRLVSLLRLIKRHLSGVKRIRLYGNAKSILAKSVEDLDELRQLGLDRIYMGLESGSDEVLQAVNKGVDSSAMIKAANRVRRGGIFLSVTILLGIAGAHRSLTHAKATAAALNAMHPNQIAALSLMLIPDTPLHAMAKRGEFQLPDAQSMLRELSVIIKNITLDRVQFQANHASNYLPVNCRLQRDKPEVLQRLGEALAGHAPLMPEYMRAL